MKRSGIRKRTWRKRSSGFKKSVASIAKKAVMKMSETKTSSVSDAGDVGTNGNLFTLGSSIVTGTAQNNRIGDKIRLLGVKIRGPLSIKSSVITTQQDTVYCRVVIFTAKRPISTITDSGLTYNGAVDPETITILSDRYVRYHVDGKNVLFNNYFKFNRVVNYNPGSTSVAKNDFYVALLPNSTEVSGITATTGLYRNFTYQLYWKDF